jgi:hypothetical protein
MIAVSSFARRAACSPDSFRFISPDMGCDANYQPPHGVDRCAIPSMFAGGPSSGHAPQIGYSNLSIVHKVRLDGPFQIDKMTTLVYWYCETEREHPMADETATLSTRSLDSRPVEYDPFHPETVEGPNRRFWADRNVWGVYKASLLLAVEEERARCAMLTRCYARQAPENERHKLLNLIRRIEDPKSTSNFTV